MTADRVRRTVANVRSGTVVPMALPWNTRCGPDDHRPALHHMTDLGDVESPLRAQGLHSRRLPRQVRHSPRRAVPHRLPGAVARRPGGGRSRRCCGRPHRCGVDAGPLAGVLPDLPAVLGTRWLEPGQEVHAEDVIAAETEHSSGAHARIVRSVGCRVCGGAVRCAWSAASRATGRALRVFRQGR